MGLFNNIKTALSGGSGGSQAAAPGNSAAYGNHSIQPSAVMTAAGGASSTNPGSFANIRTVQGPDEPRYFTTDEAAQLHTEAKEKREAARTTKAAYRSLSAIEAADVTVQEAHYGYLAVSAAAELQKQKVKVKYAGRLHGMRSSYAALSHRLELSDQGAQQRIEATRSRMDEQFQQTLNKLRGNSEAQPVEVR